MLFHSGEVCLQQSTASSSWQATPWATAQSVPPFCMASLFSGRWYSYDVLEHLAGGGGSGLPKSRTCKQGIKQTAKLLSVKWIWWHIHGLRTNEWTTWSDTGSSHPASRPQQQLPYFSAVRLPGNDTCWIVVLCWFCCMYILDYNITLGHRSYINLPVPQLARYVF